LIISTAYKNKQTNS